MTTLRTITAAQIATYNDKVAELKLYKESILGLVQDIKSLDSFFDEDQIKEVAEHIKETKIAIATLECELTILHVIILDSVETKHFTPIIIE